MGRSFDSTATARRWTLAEKLLAILTALLALGSAALGLWTAQITQAKEQAQASAATKGTDLSTLQGQFDQLKSQNQQLQSDNAQLRSRLGLPGPTGDAQPTRRTTVRHSGPVTLSFNGNGVDLDSPASDPQWETGAIEIRYASDRSFLVTSPVIDLGDTKSDYDTCRNTTGYRAGSYDTGSVAVGNYFCVKTSDQRYSALKITGLTAQYLSLDIVTYDPAGN
jgi:hypothetical protein